MEIPITDSVQDQPIPMAAICSFWQGLVPLVINGLEVSVSVPTPCNLIQCGKFSRYPEASRHTRFHAEFDLDGRRNAMDESAMQVAEFQEETVVKRKELASSTRSFKGKATSEISKAVGPLLKAYQGEVDRLTRR